MYQNNKEAYELSNTYGFCPPHAVYPSKIRNTNPGKFEPDQTPAADFRCITLAHYADATNILIKYNPELDFIAPYIGLGIVSPDSTGQYMPDSAYNNKPTYARKDRAWFIWFWKTVLVKPEPPVYADIWVVSQEVGSVEGPYWQTYYSGKLGTYTAKNGATGLLSIINPVDSKYNVTGTLTPDITGNYYWTGTFNNLPYYKKKDENWFIWWASFWWEITDELGIEHEAFWLGDPFTDIVGEYTPFGTAEGTATVALGEL